MNWPVLCFKLRTSMVSVHSFQGQTDIFGTDSETCPYRGHYKSASATILRSFYFQKGMQLAYQPILLSIKMLSWQPEKYLGPQTSWLLCTYILETVQIHSEDTHPPFSEIIVSNNEHLHHVWIQFQFIVPYAPDWLHNKIIFNYLRGKKIQQGRWRVVDHWKSLPLNKINIGTDCERSRNLDKITENGKK